MRDESRLAAQSIHMLTYMIKMSRDLGSWTAKPTTSSPLKHQEVLSITMIVCLHVLQHVSALVHEIRSTNTNRTKVWLNGSMAQWLDGPLMIYSD